MLLLVVFEALGFWTERDVLGSYVEGGFDSTSDSWLVSCLRLI
jgi:hypothetical protein